MRLLYYQRRQRPCTSFIDHKFKLPRLCVHSGAAAQIEPIDKI
jgi:hypothetical protein